MTIENININVDGNKSPKEMVDEIAYEIAVKLEPVFANMPLTAN